MKESEAEVKLDASSLGHIWHAGLPDAPAGFPKEADFALTRSEAEFLRDCICESHGDSFLAYLANHGIPDPSIPFPWLAPDRDMYTEAHKRLLYHAHLFSTVMHGASIAYNYFLDFYPLISHQDYP